jgi:hypothetical protein
VSESAPTTIAEEPAASTPSSIDVGACHSRSCLTRGWLGNKQMSALTKRARGLEISGLQFGYKVLLTSKARVDKLDWVESTLRRLEDPEARSAVPRRTENYESIVSWPALSPGQVIFATGGGGGSAHYNAENVVTAATEMLTRVDYADVARKLGAHGGAERHAVVIVDEEQTPAFAWLRQGRPDDLRYAPEPSLQEEITHLWISPRNPQALTVRWSPDGGWNGILLALG